MERDESPAVTTIDNEPNQTSQEEKCGSSACHSSSCANDIPETEGSREDFVHTAKVLAAFLWYKYHARLKVYRNAQSFSALTPKQKSFVGEKHNAQMKTMMKCIDQNNDLFSSICSVSANTFGDGEDALNYAMHLVKGAEQGEEAEPNGEFLSKTRSVLKQIVREWSSIGKSERDATYQPILAELERRYPEVSKRSDIRILVPGAGLGRLAWELGMRNFSVQANEHSLFMLLASSFILNGKLEENCHTIYPFVLDQCNSWSYANQLLPVPFPDVSPMEMNISTHSNFSMAAGDFLEATREEKDEYDCVVTSWFLDTAHNILDYVECIHRILKPGGVWINCGPLMYHFSDIPGEQSVELPYDELTNYIRSLKFVLTREEKVESTYTANPNSMLRHSYTSAFFVAEKPSLA